MTREEAIALLNEQYETCKRIYDCSADQRKNYPNVPQFMEALSMSLSALRPVSREQVEKVWRGEWQMVSNGSGVCSECHRQDKIDPLAKFCRYCGAPLTDEAVQMVMDRLNKLEEMANEH